MSKSDPLIRIAGLAKKFGGVPVLAGINLEIERGETIAIIGRSGCGKSVLLKHVLGLLRADAGSITVAGHDIMALDETELAQVRLMFGMVFQGAALFDSQSVADNVGFALRRLGRPEPEVLRIIEERLAQVGLPGVGAKYPAELSGGMRKRVGLARALAVDPEILLYDEPTTGLDPIMSDAISDLILETQERTGVTSVVVTHDMTLAYKVSRRIAMLYQGTVRFLGTPDEIRRSPDDVVQQFIAGRAKGPIAVNTLA